MGDRDVRTEEKLTVGSLFSGIGGFELGLENTGGFTTKWQVECDPYARRILEKHWPDVLRHDNVKTFPPRDWKRQHLEVDVICGGFPCQDISDAGKRQGIEGERSGLWSEFARIIRLVRPRFVVVENVAALLRRGAGRVLGDLATCGYDAEWDCVPAAALGAPHHRDRAFIIAYPDADCRRFEEQCASHHEAGCYAPQVPDADSVGREAWSRLHERWPSAELRSWWDSEPDVCRVADGVPRRVDRLRALGNAVVPQVAEHIGELVLERYRCLSSG